MVRSHGERPTPSPGEGALEACPEPSQASPKGVSGESRFLAVTQAGAAGMAAARSQSKHRGSGGRSRAAEGRGRGLWARPAPDPRGAGGASSLCSPFPQLDLHVSCPNPASGSGRGQPTRLLRASLPTDPCSSRSSSVSGRRTWGRLAGAGSWPGGHRKSAVRHAGCSQSSENTPVLPTPAPGCYGVWKEPGAQGCPQSGPNGGLRCGHSRCTGRGVPDPGKRDR